MLVSLIRCHSRWNHCLCLLGRRGCGSWGVFASPPLAFLIIVSISHVGYLSMKVKVGRGEWMARQVATYDRKRESGRVGVEGKRRWLPFFYGGYAL